jgi:hypothetical protein
LNNIRHYIRVLEDEKRLGNDAELFLMSDPACAGPVVREGVARFASQTQSA